MTTLRNPLRLAEGRFIQTWLGRVFFVGILLLTVGSGIVLSRRLLTPAEPGQLLHGQQLAWALVTALESDLTVTEVTGTYLPDRGLILQSSVTTDDTAALRLWTQQQLEPFLTRFAQFPAAEELIWLIDLPVDSATTDTLRGHQEILTVRFGQIDDPLHYGYISNLRPTSATTQNANQIPAVTEGEEATVADSPQESSSAAAIAKPDPPVTMNSPVINSDNVSSTPILLRSLDFDSTATTVDVPSEWVLVSGTWSAQDGYYRQSDLNGYDSIAMLNLPPQQDYQLEATLRMNSGEMGGGFIYNAPSLDSRAGAQTIDMDEEGRYLRWGRYDDDGLYIFEGGVALDVGLTDGNWHQLRLVTRADAGTIWFDNEVVGSTVNRSSSGHVGLITSRAEVDFDNLTLTVLPTTEPAADTLSVSTLASAAIVTTTQPFTAVAPLTTLLAVATDATTTTAPLFADAFDAENRNGWQVLDGTWQFLDGTYQQTSLDGTDLGTISPFQGERYRVTVRTRLLEGAMGAGLYFNMASRTSKRQSQLIHFRDGKTLQWGAFDEGGNFVLQGSTTIPNIGDGNWHQLTVEVTTGTASFAIDNIVVAGAVPLRYKAGYLGLFTGKSRVAFDDLIVTALSPVTTAEAQATE